MSRWTIRLSITLVSLSACAPAPQATDDTEPETGPLPSTIPEVRAAIDSTIGDAQATDISGCRLIALGVRPCGGPRMYRAYSVGETDSTYLAGLAGIYEQLDGERNAELGLIGTCEVLARPELEFVDGRCATGGNP